MKYLVQIMVYGYTYIDAEDENSAKELAEDLDPWVFDMSRDSDIDVVGEAEE